MTLRIVRGELSPAGTSYSTTTLQADDGANALAVSPGSGGTIVSDADAFGGSFAVKMTSSGAAVPVWTIQFPAPCSVGAVSIMRKAAAWPGTTFQWIQFQSATGALLFRVGINTAGKLFFSTFTGATSVVEGRYNRYEFTFDQGTTTTNGKLTVNCYQGNNTGTPDAVVSATTANLVPGTLVDRIVLGQSTAFAFSQLYDNVMLDDGRTTEIGPLLSVFTGTAVLSGSGTLTTDATPATTGAAALSGTGSLTASGAPGGAGAASLTGGGSLTTQGTPGGTGTAALSGSGTLTASGGGIGTGSAALSGSGTLTATGSPKVTPSAALTGTGTLTANGTPRPNGVATLTGTGTLTATGTMGGGGAVGTATLTGSGTLTATSTPRVAGVAVLSGGGTLVATGTGIDPGAAQPGGMVMRLVAYTPNGSSLGPVPTPQSVSMSLVLNDLGALSLAYPLEGPKSALLGQPVELAVLVSTDTGATWAEPPNARFLYTQDARDPVKSEAYQIDCPSYVKRFDKALVPFTSLNADGQREFTAANPGMILNPLLGEAQARGALAGISWDFSATVDSAGATWPVATRQNIAYAPGTTFLAILQSMVEAGLVDFRMSGRTLQMYAPLTALAADRTTGTNPVSLRFGRDLTEAPFRRTWDGLADTAYVQGEDRSSLIRTNGGAITPWGRQETFVTASGVSDTGTLTTVADAALSATDKARVERTYGLDFTKAPYLPLRDYAPGEWVYGATEPDTAPERMRVRQVTLTLSDQGVAQGNVVLNDRFLEADIMQARALSKLTGGATQGGTGSSPSGNDILAPAQVTGLGAATSAFVGAGGFVKAQITLDWNDTTTNADGTTASDIDHYEVHRRRQGDATWTLYRETPSSLMTDSPYEPNETWEFRVRAVDSVYNRGAFSSTVAILTAVDTTPPAQPSQPSATSTVKGAVQIGWDGLTSAAGAMPTDLAYVEAHIKTVSNFTPTPSDITTMVYRFRPGGGLATILNQPENTTMYVRLVAVDTSGNASTPSVQRAVLVSKGSDGAVPVIPGGWTPVLKQLGVGSLQAQWPLIPNTDTVTYDVYAVDANAVAVFNSTTLVGSTTGGSLPITALPGGPLLAGTDYYLAVRVSDVDGYAAGAGAHGAAGPTQVRLADVATISAGWVYAGTVNAAQVETGVMSADIVMAGKMFVGDAIVFDPLLGMTITQTNGDTTYMRADGTGNRFSGTATLSETIIQGNLSIQGITNVLAGQMRMSNGYSDPTVPPLVAQDVVNRTAATGGRGYDRRGLWGEAGFWVTTDNLFGSGNIGTYTKTGDPGALGIIATVTNNDCQAGVTKVAGKWWIAGHDKATGTWRLRRYSAAGAQELDVPCNSTAAANRCAIGTDGTLVFLVRVNNTNQVFVESYDATTGAVVGNVLMTGAWAADPAGLYVGTAGGLFAASRYVIATRAGGTRVYSTAGARQNAEEWADATTYTNQGMAFDSGTFHRWNGETVWSFTDEPGGSREFGVAWYRLQTTDLVGNPITPVPLESRVGTTLTVSHKRFWRTKMVAPRAPNDPTDAQSPDTTKVYAGVAGGTLYLQGTLPNTGTDTVVVNKLATTTAEKLSSDYDSIPGAIGKFYSTGLNLAGLRTIELNGDGSGRAGPIAWDAAGNGIAPYDTGWTNGTLTGAWVAFGGVYASAGYRRVAGVVYLRGVVKSGALNTSVFTLPTGFRPDKNYIFPVLANDALARVEVRTDGTVVVMVGNAGTYLSLDTISFMAA